MKVLTVVGARPQFIKAWPVSAALARSGVAERVVHTGQHYDEAMSGRFFAELGLAPPHANLGVGSGSHGAQTGKMLEALEQQIIAERPDWVLVYGDTNSTLGAALAAAKLHVPVAHVEAGLRSFNRRMPEEINRVLTDHVSGCLFCPSVQAVENLQHEGITRGVQVVGDVMFDALLHFSALAERKSAILTTLNLSARSYFLATIHRAENTDDATRLRALLDTLASLGRPTVLPLHPRTRALLEKTGGLPTQGALRIVEPVGYLDMLALTRNAAAVLTDSGGLQKEAYWLRTRCLTLRPETEWVETVQAGWNTVVNNDSARIHAALAAPLPATHPELYGDGHAADRIVGTLLANARGEPSPIK